MPLTLGSNIASLQAQRQLSHASNKLSTVFERLSSGQRINRASDDAAGLAISESLHTDRKVYTQAIRNLNDGLSVLNIADSAVSELSGIVIRLRELAEQAANGSFSHTQRTSLDVEAQELSEEFFRISRAVDFNGLRLFDGSIEDGLRLQAGYGTDGSIFSSLGGVMGDGTFQAEQVFGAGTQPESSTLGDVNGDGVLDIVVGNTTSDDVSILLGIGDGSFQSAQTYAAGNGVGSVSLGDLNGDGVLDIVTANFASSDVTVLLGIGDGSFQSAQTFVAGTGAQSVALGDLNNDGVLDITTSNGSVNASVLLGQGDGTFETAQNYTTGGNPQSISLGDLNGDGVLDIVTANYADDDLSVLFGNGDGTFQNKQDYTAGLAPSAVALGDVNGDGALDMVVSNYYDTDVSVFLGTGDGSFQARQDYSVGVARAYAVTLGDVNSDGQLDIVTANNGDAVLLGNGDGTFQSFQTVTTNTNAAKDVNLGDLDGDGVLDFVSSRAGGGGGAVVLLGGTREGIAPILEFSLQTQADALQALAPLERKLNSLSEQRGVIGAFQSRLLSARNTLSATSENYASAESRIRDADIATESSQLARLSILQQAATAVLGQANQHPALALQLLSSP